MVRKEKGYILLLALIIVTISALIMGGFFLYLNASLSASGRSEERSVTYYAADTGFEDAIFWLKQGKELAEWVWNEEEQQWQREPYEIYGRTVDVSVVEDLGNLTNKIISTATAINSSTSTTIEAYVLSRWFDLSPFGENAITSQGNVKILGQKGGVQGNVTYVGTLECTGDPNCEETINGTVTQVEEIEYWPEGWEVYDYFYNDVDDLDPFPDHLIDVFNTPIIEPLYREGNLLIQSSVKGTSATLNGTIYVTGDLEIGQHNQDFTLNLNHHTIFVEGTREIDPKDGEEYDTIKLDGKCTIAGSGAMIALGNIDFGPKIQTGEEDFVFLMSVEGMTTLNPMNDFHGSIGGNAKVALFPGTNLIWIDPADAGCEFPEGEFMVRILTYDIIK